MGKAKANPNFLGATLAALRANRAEDGELWEEFSDLVEDLFDDFINSTLAEINARIDDLDSGDGADDSELGEPDSPARPSAREAAGSYPRSSEAPQPTVPGMVRGMVHDDELVHDSARVPRGTGSGVSATIGDARGKRLPNRA